MDDKKCNTVTCSDCEIEWKNYCPLCKKSVVTEYPVIQKERRKKQSIKTDIPIQTLPITIDNFFIKTMGVFTEIYEIPSDFVMFFSSKGSRYYTNHTQDKLIRKSNHWGHGIKFCSWQLNGYKHLRLWDWQKKYGKTFKIGIISLSELSININRIPKTKQGKKIESRHPF
jgi:hypothetical protein